MKQSYPSSFKTVITPQRRALKGRLKELIAYRDLLGLFIKRNFTSQYKQTILGPAWAVLQPLLTTVVFTLIFGNVAGLASCGKVPSFLFYLSGTVTWQFFSNSLTQTSSTFISNAHIMGKVYFPRLVVPLSTVCTQFISYVIQMGMFAVFYVIYQFNDAYVFGINGYVWLLPLCIVQMALLGLGCGIIVSALTTKYRDLAMLVSFGMQLWMYATPVAYSLSLFEGGWLYRICLINPMTTVIETTRYALLGSEAGSFMPTQYLISWLVTVAVLFLGVCLFNKVEKNFMDTI